MDAVQLARISGLKKKTVENIIIELNEEFMETRRCFRIENVSGGYRLLTLPEYHHYVNKAKIREKTTRLSQAALETLAVIAYKQPVTKAEIERIRGVDGSGVLKTLMTKNLVVIDGKSSAPGNPLLYKTSEYFLEFFGLPSTDHLPPLTEIEDSSEGLPSLILVKSGESDGDDEEAESENTGKLANRINEDEKSTEISDNACDKVNAEITETISSDDNR